MARLTSLPSADYSSTWGQIHDEKIKVITPPGPDPRKVHDLNRVLVCVQKPVRQVVLSGVSMVYRDGRVCEA
jgi:hypothetical protein